MYLIIIDFDPHNLKIFNVNELLPYVSQWNFFRKKLSDTSVDIGACAMSFS